jgi:hypothetical protein
MVANLSSMPLAFQVTVEYYSDDNTIIDECTNFVASTVHVVSLLSPPCALTMCTDVTNVIGLYLHVCAVTKVAVQ